MIINNDELTDSDIIARVIGGDTDTFRLIVERYEAKLMRYSLYLLKDYDAASDVVQDSFIKAYINLRRFRLGKPFSPWIYRIVHNSAMNAIKSGKKTCSMGAIDEINDNFIKSFDTDRIIDKKFLDKKVRLCLGKIGVKYRGIIELSYFENLKYEEISDILHIPTSTVGVRIRRAKEMLRKVCEKEGVDYE